MILLITIFLLWQIHGFEGTSVKLQGSSDHAVRGESFMFTCSVQNEGNIGTLTFTRNGDAALCTVVVSNCSQAGFSGYRCGCIHAQTGVYFLNISRVQTDRDEGAWQCVRSVKSNNVTLPVYYPASITSFTINSRRDTQTVNETDPVNMTCKVGSKPNSTIRLKTGSGELKRGDNSEEITHSWRAECRQRGNYSCEASNSIGDVATSQVNLLVNCHPRIDKILSSKTITASVGENATFSARLLSFPRPSISWRKTSNSSSRNLSSRSREIPESDISVVASLTLIDIQGEDFGEYLLEAHNDVGENLNFTFSLLDKMFFTGSTAQMLFGYRTNDVTGEAPAPTENDPGSHVGLIAGVCVGACVVLLMVGGAVLWRHRRRPQTPQQPTVPKTEKDLGTKGATLPKTGRDADGCVYVEVEASSTSKPQIKPPPTETTVYAGIQTGVVGDPLPGGDVTLEK